MIQLALYDNWIVISKNNYIHHNIYKNTFDVGFRREYMLWDCFVTQGKDENAEEYFILYKMKHFSAEMLPNYCAGDEQ